MAIKTKVNNFSDISSHQEDLKWFTTIQQSLSNAKMTLSSATINAAANGVSVVSIGNGAGFGATPSKVVVVTGFNVTATAPVIVWFSLGNKNYYVTAGPGQTGDGILHHCTGTYLDNAGCAMFAMQVLDPTTYPNVTIYASIECYQKQTDVRTGMKLRWLGDSISWGVGISKTHEQFQRMFVDRCRKVGKYVKSDMQGKSGTTTLLHDPWFKSGYYDEDIENVGGFVFQLGVNDSRVATRVLTATYKAIILDWVVRIINTPRRPNMPILLIGPTPLWDDADYADGLTKNTALSQIAALYPTQVFFINLIDAYDRKSATYTGDQLHPNATGHLALDAAMAAWLTTSDGQLYLSKLPV